MTAPPPLSPAQESALRCLGEMSALHARALPLEQILREHDPGPDARPAGVVHAARSLGMRARAGSLSWKQLLKLDSAFPVMALAKDGRWMIVVGVVADAEQETVAVLDPQAEQEGLLPKTAKAFCDDWSGTVVYVKRRLSLSDETQPFGLGWVAAQALREKSVFRDVALAAIMSQIISLGVPIYFQLVVDKVLAHHATSTLAVLTVGVLMAVLFDAGFTYLRRSLTLHATMKIDMRLSLKTFAHLLSLPLPYFETTPTGVISRHMQQVEKIREFLTGRLFNTALDCVTLIVVLPALFFYSVKLTLLVLLIAACMAGVVAALVGPFRKRLLSLYNIEAKRQAMMVETVSGMRTIKSLAVEGPQVRKWEERSALAVSGHFRVGMISAGAQAVIGGLEKMMTIVIVGVGAFDVFDGSLSVGALVGFNMLAGRITGPLVQMASLIQDWQETSLSIRMLGEVMNRPPERAPGSLGLTPPIRGGLQLDGVSFRYGPDLPPALDRINLTIPPGAVVGVVGRSGSGKTTLTRLVQGLFNAQDGIMRIDGVDIRQIDLQHLRRHIGVVLQENVLFEGTVVENIQMGRPGATAEEAVECGRLAGAHEFVERLPQGYETVLEENGSNLSGGQRQRLAIARALIAKPRLLILDEATSALDPESEAIVMDNLERIAQGRTVLIVSHRLNTLTECDSILVMERGRIVAAGRHNDLLAKSETYKTLWAQQNRHAAARAARAAAAGQGGGQGQPQLPRPPQPGPGAGPGGAA